MYIIPPTRKCSRKEILPLILICLTERYPPSIAKILGVALVLVKTGLNCLIMKLMASKPCSGKMVYYCLQGREHKTKIRSVYSVRQRSITS